MTAMLFEDDIHEFRKEVDVCIKRSESYIQSNENIYHKKYIREMSLVRTKLQEAKMWLGKVLESTGSQLPAEYRDEA